MSTPSIALPTQARATGAGIRPRRPWIRGVFRPDPQTSSKRGLAGSLLLHLAAGAIAVSGALDGLGAMDVLSRTAAFSTVVVQLPRVAPPEPAPAAAAMARRTRRRAMRSLSPRMPAATRRFSR